MLIKYTKAIDRCSEVPSALVNETVINGKSGSERIFV